MTAPASSTPRSIDDEQAATAAAFWHRAAAWFAAHGIPCERVITDNGSCYKLRALAGRLRRHRHHRQEDPTPPTADQRQDRALPPHPARGMGLHPALDLRQPNAHAGYAGFIHFYSGRKAERNSSEKSSGSSQAAKWPPLSTSLK